MATVDHVTFVMPSSNAGVYIDIPSLKWFTEHIKSKVSVCSSQKVCHTARGNSHAIWVHTVLPAT